MVIKKRKQQIEYAGFTIVELLIVIVVIGILAALVMNSFSQAQDRARAVAVANGIKTIEKAFTLYMVEDGIAEWWDDETMKDPATGESTIKYMIDTTPLGKYIKEVPQVSGFNDTFWTYDNDGNIYDGCSTTSNGVNIQTTLSNQNIAQKVDEILDDGNLACGKVRIDSQNELVYSLSRSSAISQ